MNKALALADQFFVDRRNNITPTRTFMGTDEELKTFYCCAQALALREAAFRFVEESRYFEATRLREMADDLESKP